MAIRGELRLPLRANLRSLGGLRPTDSSVTFPVPTLASFDQTDRDVDCLALLTANIDGDIIYKAAERGGTDTPDEGELGIGPDDTRITQIRRFGNDGDVILLNDNNVPAALNLGTYFDTGDGGDKTLTYMSEHGNFEIGPLEDSRIAGGNGFVRFSVPASAHRAFRRLRTGDVYLLAIWEAS